jgi:hypothetical protein
LTPASQPGNFEGFEGLSQVAAEAAEAAAKRRDAERQRVESFTFI